MGAVPSTKAERREPAGQHESISQGDMLIAAKQKRLMSASVGGNRKDMRKVGSYQKEEEKSKINEYNEYMQRLMNM